METIFVLIVGIVTFLIFMFYIVAMWKLYTKAGEKGWASLVPFYNTYIMFKICKMDIKWFVAYMVVSFPFMIIEIPANEDGTVGTVSNAIMLVLVLSFIFSMVIFVKQIISLSKVFGKEKSFALGLFFLPIVFIPLLAFGNSKYIK